MGARGPRCNPTTMIGRTFGRLTVIARAHRAVSGHYYWLCRCACGVQKAVSAPNLYSGQKSCGCQQREQLSARSKARHASKTHCAKGHPYTDDNVIRRVFKDGSTQRACRTCQREAGREQAQRHRELIHSLKPKCSRCDETHPACLDFHHIDPTLKEFTINTRTTRSIERITAEAAKCEVLCANCHRKLHYDERQERAS